MLWHAFSCSDVQMRQRVIAASTRFAGKSIEEALEEPLTFRICVSNPVIAACYPNLFEEAECEYGYYLDTLIKAHAPLVQNSETCVSNRDSLFLHTMKSLLPKCDVSLNQAVCSSGTKRHNFTLTVGGVLGLFGEEKIDDIEEAIAQLLDSVHLPSFDSVLPRGLESVPAFATTNDTIAVYSVSIDQATMSMKSTILCSFHFPSERERVMFVECLFKLICWLSALPKATHAGAPVPGKNSRNVPTLFISAQVLFI